MQGILSLVRELRSYLHNQKKKKKDKLKKNYMCKDPFSK